MLLRETAQELGGPRAELAVAVEQAVTDALRELRPGRDLRTNVEFHAGVVMEACGIPPELFTPTFAVSRTVGWTAHAARAGPGAAASSAPRPATSAPRPPLRPPSRDRSSHRCPPTRPTPATGSGGRRRLWPAPSSGKGWPTWPMDPWSEAS